MKINGLFRLLQLRVSPGASGGTHPSPNLAYQLYQLDNPYSSSGLACSSEGRQKLGYDAGNVPPGWTVRKGPPKTVSDLRGLM
jgi:hypothetical protein